MISLMLFLNPLRDHFEPQPMSNGNDASDQFIGTFIFVDIGYKGLINV